MTTTAVPKLRQQLILSVETLADPAFRAAVTLIAPRSVKRPTASVREAESVKESGQETAPSATGTALRAESDDRLARERDDVGAH
ncbi:hypothetical protein [Streptomyces chryseus]